LTDAPQKVHAGGVADTAAGVDTLDISLRRRLPNLIIVGVMKCGTTSLHYYLGLHPQISMSREKELEFFIGERNWSRGAAWYARQFDARTAVRGESSPNYAATGRFSGVPARMREVVPEAKLIFMVRDPIERLISHWIHNFSHGREQRPFAEILDDDRYLERSMYATQLRPYLDAFPREQILILEMEELRVQRLDVLRRVLGFLAVDSTFDSPRFRLERHRTARKRSKTRLGTWLAGTRFAQWIESLPQSMRWPARDLLYLPFSRRMDRPLLSYAERQNLVERLKPDAEQFRDLTGLSCTGWSV
jgi:hypothetical protein